MHSHHFSIYAVWNKIASGKNGYNHLLFQRRSSHHSIVSSRIVSASWPGTPLILPHVEWLNASHAFAFMCVVWKTSFVRVNTSKSLVRTCAVNNCYCCSSNDSVCHMSVDTCTRTKTVAGRNGTCPTLFRVYAKFVKAVSSNLRIWTCVRGILRV